MTFNWLTVGDQDQRTCKVCPLGPYILEHVEASSWVDNKLMMESNVYLWNDSEQEYDEIDVQIPNVEYKRNESYKVLEDWYALNVLSEKLFIGIKDESKDNTVQGK